MAEDVGGSRSSIDAEFTGSQLDSNERLWAAGCHLSAFAGYLLVIPFASVIGPLVVWLLKKDQMPFVDEHGKESINFQITISIAYAVAIVLCFMVIGFFILPVLGVWNVVLVVLATIKASNGEHFRYPLTLRLVR